MKVFKRMMIPLLLVTLTGCSQIFIAQSKVATGTKLLECEEEAEPKSLQLLEQKYRCTVQ